MKSGFFKSALWLLSAILFAPSGAFAQTPFITWKKCLGGSFIEDAYCMQATQDGGLIASGEASSTSGDVSGLNGYHDFWVIKLNSSGNLEWQKCLGGDGEESARDIRQTSDGGYIVAGFAQSNNGDVSGNHGGNYDAWIVKLSSTGSLEWQKCLGGSAEDKAYGIRQCSDGGYVMTGFTKSVDGDVTSNNGWTDLWVVKLNSGGALEWQKCFGGSEGEEGWSILQTTDGGYMVCGKAESTDGNVTGNHGNGDAWILKLSSSGVLEWQKCIGGGNTDTPISIISCQEGGYLVAGETQSTNGDVSGGHGSYDAWIFKLSSSGTLEWQQCFGGTDYDNFWSVNQVLDGSYTAAGFSYSNNGDVSNNQGSSDYWVVNMSNTGQLNWQKSLGGTLNENARSVQSLSDGTTVVAGYSVSVNGDVSGNHGEADFWIVKLNPLTPVPELNSESQVFQIYPNPATDFLQVSMDESEPFSLQIFNSLGEKIMEQFNCFQQVEIKTSQLPPGLYSVQFKSENKTGSLRFIRKH